MNRFKFHFSTVKSAGFGFDEVDDEVFFDQYGYSYTIVKLEISSFVFLHWDQTTGYIKLVALSEDNEGDVLAEVPIHTEEEYLKIVRRVTKRKKAKKRK